MKSEFYEQIMIRTTPKKGSLTIVDCAICPAYVRSPMACRLADMTRHMKFRALCSVHPGGVNNCNRIVTSMFVGGGKQ